MPLTHPTVSNPTASQSTHSADTDLDIAARVRILVEAAMEQSKFSDSDAQLVIGQLAEELNRINAALSDVRIAVHTLYKGDRSGAEAYLGYLADNGFPAPRLNQTPPASASVASSRQDSRLYSQQQAVARHSAYGQSTGTTSAKRTERLSRIAFYSGNLISELVANSAYSALVLGERRSGTSAILRAILYDQLNKCGSTIIDVLDLHSGEWGGLEAVRFEEGSKLVTYHTVCSSADIAAVSQQIAAVAAEVRRREHQQRQVLTRDQRLSPYLFLIDGLSEIHGALPGWTPDRRSKDADFSQAASSLRFVLCHGPAVAVSCVATARDHDNCLCDATALGETKLLFLGRVSTGRNGGYRAIDRAIEDKQLLPSPQERSRYREAVSTVKALVHPVVFTPSGIPRLGTLGNFAGYLQEDLLSHYQQAIEVGATV